MLDHVGILDMVVGDPRQIDHMLAIAAAGEADIGFTRFAGAVDDAAQHRQRHRGADMLEPFLQGLDGADDVEPLPRAAWAGDDADAAVADAERFQNFIADADFFLGLGRQGDADGVADPGPQQAAHADRGFDGATDQPAGLGNPYMERAINRLGELVVGGDREEQVAGLHRNLVIAKIVILEDADMIERAFDQRLGTRFAIFFEQIFLKAAGVDPDADRAAIGLGGVDDLADALGRADVAGIDAQAGGAGVGGLERALVMEMDVGDDRHVAGADDLLERGGTFDVGAGDADDVDPGLLAAADLVDRRLGIRGGGVGHRLDGDRRIAADGNVADHDLTRLTARNVAPGPDGHCRDIDQRCPRAKTTQGIALPLILC